MLPPVTLPVVLIVLEPNAPNKDTTLLLPYVVVSLAQLKLPAPSVDNICPIVPPAMCKLETLPNVTFAVLLKLTIPVALLTVYPVKLPMLVIFG